MTAAETTPRWVELAVRQRGSLANRALNIAQLVHGDERDRRGVPYIQHAIGVAELGLTDWRNDGPTAVALRKLGLDEMQVAAILLDHDTLEHGFTLQGLADARLGQTVIAFVDGLTFIPAPGMGLAERVRGQAAKLKTQVGAPLLKTYDLGHNLLPDRLFPYMGAHDTVHQVWKYKFLTTLIGVLPYGMPNGFDDLPSAVKALPGVNEIITGQWPLDQPPRENLDLMAELRNFPTIAAVMPEPLTRCLAAGNG